VPRVIVELTRHLMLPTIRGLHTKGIFRVGADKHKQGLVLRRLNAGTRLANDTEAHIASNLIKVRV